MKDNAREIAKIMKEADDKLAKLGLNCLLYFSVNYIDKGSRHHFSGGNCNNAMKLYFSRRMQIEVERGINKELESIIVDYTPPVKK